MTSLPRIHTGCDSPKGMKLYFIGDSREHATRAGTTREQYDALAGEPDYTGIMPDKIIGRQALILEDLNRGLNDTVVGGACLVIVRSEQSDDVEFHLLSAVMREEYRRKGLANFVIGRVLSTTLTNFSGTELIVHRFNGLDASMKQVLFDKGFSVTGDGNAAVLKLPGIEVPAHGLENLSAAEEEIALKQWSGIYGNRVYREGQYIGEIKREDEDDLGDWRLGIYDASGQLKDVLECDDINVDWKLTAATMLVNSGSIQPKK